MGRDLTAPHASLLSVDSNFLAQRLLCSQDVSSSRGSRRPRSPVHRRERARRYVNRWVSGCNCRERP